MKMTIRSHTVAPLLGVVLLASMVLNAIGPSRQAAADEVWIPVGTAVELNNMRNDLAGHYKLTQDIDLGGYDFGDGNGWKPVGNMSTPFTGKLDGNGFAIRNMTIDRINDNMVGLFGFTQNAAISSVHLIDAQVQGIDSVGGIAGVLTQSTLTGSSVEGSVTGSNNAGVLVGYNDFSNIADSYAAGQLIVGASPVDSFGGLVGYSAGNGSSGTIKRSYSTAAVDSATWSGGLIGQTVGVAAIASSYWDTQTSGLSASSGGTGKTTAEMKLKATFAGWDFTGGAGVDPVWGMVEKATYPLHYSDYRKVALATLTVKDGDDAVQPLDRDFSSDYGVYSVRVVSKTDHVVVAGTALSPSSVVSVDGGGASSTLALNPGANDFQIQVSDPDNPAGLNAAYRLTIYRDAGSAMYPHRITTAEQLSHIGDPAWGYGLDQTYELDADLDLSGFTAGAGWAPIGSEAEPFEGTVDGNDHTIVHLTMDRPGQDHAGLFGFASGAVIAHIALPDADIRGHQHVGGLIGRAENTAVNGISVQGMIAGDSDAAGLIGSADALTTVSESYTAAEVTTAGGSAGGLIASGAAGGAVTHSFWDSERSGQPASSGGGTPKTTAEMMQQATFTGYPGSVWAFGSGSRWGIVEGTTYPMPWASYAGAIPSGLAVAAAGTTVLLTPAAFAPAKGVYTAALAAPVPQAKVTVTPAAGQAVAINGAAGASADIELSLGDNPVTVEVTGANGAKAVYSLTLTVPSPVPVAVQVPPDAIYGIGDELDWVVTYDFPVDVDAVDPPKWQIGLDGRAAQAASYIGKFAGQANKLLFRYTVQAGDLDSTGVQPATSLIASTPAAVTANGDPVSLDLPTPLPDTSGIILDGEAPSISLTPTPAVPTRDAINVAVTADGTGTDVIKLKWAKGVRNAAYFAGSGTDVSGAAFTADTNGSYTVYAADEAGNETVETIGITNILTDKPTLTLDPNPKAGAPAGVDVTVTATVYDNGGGNRIESLRWAAGTLTAADFASPAFGEAVPVSGAFHVSRNGAYTVYAADSAGNEQVKTIEITNVVVITASGGSTSAVPPKPQQFHLVPGMEYTLTVDGLKLQVPAGAIMEPTNVSIADITKDVQSLLPIDQTLLSGVYELLKDTAGKFAVPLTLQLDLTSNSWEAGQHPVLAYYDELSRKWVSMGGMAAGGVFTGKTDHFTKFAVLLVADESGQPEADFTDIAGHWAEAAILEGAAQGIVTGYPDGTFRPDAAVSRAEFAVMLDRVLRAGESDQALSFTDRETIPEWASAAVAGAVHAGVIEGYPDGRFRPAANINRAETAAMIAKAADLQLQTLPGASFADDAAIAGWAKPFIDAAHEAGLVEGQAGGRFEPLAATTRAEAVVLLLRLSEYMNAYAPF